jgi:hypothetical protein
MADSLVSFLSALSSKVFWFAAILFVLLNGAALAAFLLTRSRRLVDEWTPRLVTADALLLGAGLGVPLVSGLAKLGIQAVASMLGTGPTTAP